MDRGLLKLTYVLPFTNRWASFELGARLYANLIMHLKLYDRGNCKDWDSLFISRNISSQDNWLWQITTGVGSICKTKMPYETILLRSLPEERDWRIMETRMLVPYNDYYRFHNFGSDSAKRLFMACDICHVCMPRIIDDIEEINGKQLLAHHK